MALPTTITGISTNVPCVGPFISSGGNVYFIGQDSSDSKKLQVFKATDPTTSFSSIASATPDAANPCSQMAGYQVGDTIHIVAASNAVSYFYYTFVMSTDTLSSSETIIAALNTADSTGTTQHNSSIVVRSGGEVVAFFNGARVANMGNSYSQTYYSRRTAVNTWSAAVQVSAGGQVDFVNPEAVIGISDAVHFMHQNSSTFTQRTLTSGNALQTAGTQAFTASVQAAMAAASYNNSGTQKIICVWFADSNSVTYTAIRFDSGNTPALSTAAVDTASALNFQWAGNDGTTAYCAYTGSTTTINVRSSTDNGATWGAEQTAMTTGGSIAGLSIDGNIFTRGSSVVIPYVVNDNGTLKYNEYVVRSIASDTLFAQSVM